MGSIFIFRGSKNVLVISVLIYFFVTSVSGCFNTGWEFLLEDLIADVCPMLASATSLVKDLLTPNSLGKFFKTITFSKRNTGIKHVPSVFLCFRYDFVKIRYFLFYLKK